MPFWSKRSKDVEVESAEQTLARLQSEAVTSHYPDSVTDALGDRQLRKQRGGYDPSEVDGFLATIDQRTPDEIRDVLFESARRSEGYNQDDVDILLDAIVAQRTGSA